MAISIRKKGVKNFFHYPTETGLSVFSLSEIVAQMDGDNLVIVEPNGAKRGEWNFSTVTVYDDTGAGVGVTFTTPVALFQWLIDLDYPAFKDDVDITNLAIDGGNAYSF